MSLDSAIRNLGHGDWMLSLISFFLLRTVQNLVRARQCCCSRSPCALHTGASGVLVGQKDIILQQRGTEHEMLYRLKVFVRFDSIRPCGATLCTLPANFLPAGSVSLPQPMQRRLKTQRLWSERLQGLPAVRSCLCPHALIARDNCPMSSVVPSPEIWRMLMRNKMAIKQIQAR